MSPFDPKFGDLPDTIPVFPLTGALLLPRGQLPLNIFEPRYLNMVSDALGAGRILGMIQPQTARAEQSTETPDLYKTGCAGRISKFEETSDGRFLISLQGLHRFDIAEELPQEKGYRRCRVDWSAYGDDLTPEPNFKLDRGRLIPPLRIYFTRHNIDANWKVIEDLADANLVTAISMMCPFAPAEKQALLQAATMSERSELLIAILELSGQDDSEGDPVKQ